MGRSAQAQDNFKSNVDQVAKIRRKKERRIAKTRSEPEHSLVIPASRVVEVRLAASGQIIFIKEDGTNSAFYKPGSKISKMAAIRSEFDSIDDDVTERYTAPPFHLQDAEYIVGVITHEKQQLGELNALCFHTST